MSEDQHEKKLLERYLRGECTDAEREIVDSWYNSFDGNADDPILDAEVRSDLDYVGRRMGIGQSSGLRRLVVYAAAAAVLAITAGIVTKLTMAPRTPTRDTATVFLEAKDILPGSDRATLTLSDGRVVSLDESYSDALPDEFGTYVIGNADGSIQYKPHELAVAALHGTKYHTLRTPKGKHFRLTMPDGSVVVLNAMSSLTYDVSRFSGERTVRLTGEAYFEVVSNADRPFRVVSDMQTITVLGTKFNVNCYPDESGTRTTLLEGMVDVATSEHPDAIRLVPGEQAFVGGSGMPLVTPTGTANPIAWINGLFHFDGQAIDEVMRELGRWYDVEIVFQGAKPATRLWGEVNRNTTADIPLKLLSFFDFNHEVTQVNGTTRITMYSH